jgi:hypothetical protein
MSNSIIAKLSVSSVGGYKSTDGTLGYETSQLWAVYSSDPASENYSFSQATPSASFNITITNPNAFGFFVEGQEYIFSISPANPKSATSESL